MVEGKCRQGRRLLSEGWARVARGSAPSTPPPPSMRSFAALTMASPCHRVRSPRCGVGEGEGEAGINLGRERSERSKSYRLSCELTRIEHVSYVCVER